MSTIKEQALALLEQSKTMAVDAFNKIVKGVPEDVRTLLYDLKKQSYFSPENRGSEREVFSDSGRYRLVITNYSTGQGTWGYTLGSVYNVETGALIGEIRRNYHAFPYVFVEDHPKGDFLIGGESYTAQTVIDLKTGEKRNSKSESSGFCWSCPQYYADLQMMIVSGCHWACPYEYRFYDFSDPLNWYELKLPEDHSYVDDDPRWPTIEGEGLIKVYQTKEDDESEEEKLGEVASYRVFRREGSELVLHELWISEEEQARRIEQEESNRRYEEAMDRYKAEDPLFLAHLELVKDCPTADNYFGTGSTYSGWCPGFEVSEQRICRRIIRDSKWSVSLEWGQTTGPVKLVIYKDGKEFENKFFMEHSADSIRAAFAYAKEVTRV